MSFTEFLSRLETAIDARPGTLQRGQTLNDIAEWDSVAVLGFIGMVDENFRFQVAAKDIAACRTVEDLAALLGDRITA